MAESSHVERPRTPPATNPAHARTPHPRRTAVPADRRAAAPLSALGGEFLTASLDLLCRREPLTRAEIGDHADVVAEVADALAAVADRLTTDLERIDLGDGGLAGVDLVRARDALHSGSAEARRGAAMLWARHIRMLRDRVERAARSEVGPDTGEAEARAPVS